LKEEVEKYPSTVGFEPGIRALAASTLTTFAEMTELVTCHTVNVACNVDRCTDPDNKSVRSAALQLCCFCRLFCASAFFVCSIMSKQLSRHRENDAESWVGGFVRAALFGVRIAKAFTVMT